MPAALNAALLVVLLTVPAYTVSLPRDTDEEDVKGKQALKSDGLHFQRWLDDYDTVPRYDEVDISDETMQADSPFYDETSVGVRTDTKNNRRSDVISTPTFNRKAQSAGNDDNDETSRCPPPILPATLIRSWCAAAKSSSGEMMSQQCRNDNDCPSTNRKRKCCNNGCRRVCTLAIAPAQYIDWKREPQTRLTSGKSWLIQGPDEPQEVEWCSTSYVYDDVTADEEPLLCPHGFRCFIDDPGDVENGVPNRGRCVPEKSFNHDKSADFKLATSYAINGTCVVRSVTHRSGETFVYEKHTCKCEDGSVMCRVGKKIPLRHSSNS